MLNGFLVNPDLTNRRIVFELEHASQFLGGVEEDRVSVAFQEDGSTYAALYSSSAKDEGAEPNPVASLGRNTAATGNPAFFTDPTTAVSGAVIFVGAEGEDITDEEIERVNQGIRAVKRYREDHPEEFNYWRSAVLNLAEHEDEHNS
ncbi:hypothetical protein KRX51_06060 [Corynebacterium sp. TAE3-ERU12]|uniref:hypothetical protein n=1 Tax=Corynebacterium sp. TAE3-ERU12 TaxID=2849491 RepID=UPI001C450E7F|nr:hypothetical protein [Corynebacterium sp. TAE3-ERU12]